MQSGSLAAFRKMVTVRLEKFLLNLLLAHYGKYSALL